MATFSDLIEEVKAHLRGQVRDQELSTYITSSINASDLTITVNDSSALSRGRCEIDDELIELQTVSRTTDTVTVPPYGRGIDGTTAASHSANAKVTFNPLFPRLRVKNAINDTIRQVDGKLYAVTSTTLTSNVAKVGYQMPAATDSIISMEWESLGGSDEWVPIRRYKLVKQADTTEFATGKAVNIFDAVPSGRTIRVYYRKSLTVLSGNSDNFASVTGLEDRAKDVIVYGALMKLASTIDAANLSTQAVERTSFDERPPYGQGTSLAKFYFSLFQQRLLEEQEYLNETYPTRPHYTR